MNLRRETHLRSRRRLLAGGLAVVVVVSALVGLSPAPASADPAAASSSAGLGTWSVAGYDWAALDREARVVARTTDTNLVFRFVAGSALSNDTLTLDIPREDWPDELQMDPWPLDPTSEGGAVVVRPHPAWPQAPGECRTAAVTWSVIPLPTVQRIVVEHVDCEPGEQIAVRLWGIASPARAGDYMVVGSVDHGSGGEAQFMTLPVHPRPRTRLSVSLPRRAQYDTPTPLVIKALRPDGRVDRSYRGAVALLSEDLDGCNFDGAYATTIYDFTAEDAGVREIAISLVVGGFRVTARDVGREARSGRSNRFTLEGQPGYIPPCPISFH